MSKAISRRDFLKVSGAVGAAGLLAACGGSSNAGSTATSTAASSAAASGVLSSPARYSSHEDRTSVLWVMLSDSTKSGVRPNA